MEEILGAKNPLHYRNKSQYPVGADGAIGFYRARSHQVVPVKRCLIQPEAADKTAAAVGEWMRRYKVPAYDEATGKGLVRHVYVRVNRKGESLCCVVINGRQAPREPELAAYVCAAVPHTAGVLVNSNTKRGNVILGEKYRTLWGRDYLMDTLCGLDVQAVGALLLPGEPGSGGSVVRQGPGLCRPDGAGDGAGPVLRHRHHYAVPGEAGRTGHRRGDRAGRPSGTPERTPPGTTLKTRNSSAATRRRQPHGWRRRACGRTSSRVDPPRKGLAPEVIGSIAAMGPERVVYVSCDPATLGRDVKRFGELGYRAVRACAVDMFPATRHVESVVLLERS